MTGPLVIGVDPGGRYTGFALIAGAGFEPELVDRVTVERDVAGSRNDRDDLVDDVYLGNVGGQLDEWLDEWGYALEDGGGVAGIAVEGLVGRWRKSAPGQKYAVDPADVIRAGTVAGAVVERARIAGVALVRVRPGNNGVGLPAAYPRVLHDPRGGCRGGKRDARCNPQCIAVAGARRHERSAFDVALSARLDLRAARR